MKILDLTNKKFGLLTPQNVIKTGKVHLWACKCECGGIINVSTFELNPGNITL